LDGTIVDGDINAAAGIQQSKLATLVIGDALITDVAASKITGTITPANNSITSAMIVDGTIVNADINTSANIS
jgi:predicted HAD superfamily phosphohydrolase YqeG